MTEREYENLQVKLDVYEDYMIKELELYISCLSIEQLEEAMESLNVYNKYKESDDY